MVILRNNPRVLAQIKNVANEIIVHIVTLQNSKNEKEIVETENMLKKLITRLSGLIEGWR